MWDWFCEEKTGWAWLRLMLQALGMALFWAIFVTMPFAAIVWVISQLVDLLSEVVGPVSEVDPSSIEMVLETTIVILILPIWLIFEELARLGPIIVVSRLSGRDRDWVLVTIVLTSVLFGLVHTINDIVWPIAFVSQGMSGFVLTVVFLKSGGLRGGWYYLKGFFAAWLVHVLFDLLLFGALLCAQVILLILEELI